MFILLAGLGVFTWWALGTRRSDNEIKAVFSEAVSVYSGLDVRVDGIDAGKVQGVARENGMAVITLGLDDESWPLREGATATLRFGTTVGNGTRILEVTRGPENGRELTEDDVITNEYTVETTEFDDVFDVFTAQTRREAQGLADGLQSTFQPRPQEVGEGIEATGPGLDSVGSLARELVRDRAALRSVIVNGARVTRTLAEREDAITDFVSNAATTFTTFADNQRGITESLDRFPEALRQTRSTLARLDGSVDNLDGFVTDIRLGAKRLVPLAQQTRPALAALRETIPTAVQTFRSGRRSAPRITGLLREAQPFSRVAAPVLEELAPRLNCLRPYAPEVAAFFTQWASWPKGYDDDGQVGRIWGNYGPSSVTSTPEVDSDAFTQASGLKYALVRPPGFNAGQPQFLPECNITQDGLDPSKDPTDVG